MRGAAKLRAGAVERLGAGASGSDGVRAALGAAAAGGGGSEQLHGELQMLKVRNYPNHICYRELRG